MLIIRNSALILLYFAITTTCLPFQETRNAVVVSLKTNLRLGFSGPSVQVQRTHEGHTFDLEIQTSRHDRFSELDFDKIKAAFDSLSDIIQNSTAELREYKERKPDDSHFSSLLDSPLEGIKSIEDAVVDSEVLSSDDSESLVTLFRNTFIRDFTKLGKTLPPIVCELEIDEFSYVDQFFKSVTQETKSLASDVEQIVSEDYIASLNRWLATFTSEMKYIGDRTKVARTKCENVDEEL